jgi:hypothetical protein
MMRFQIESKQQGALSFCFVFLWVYPVELAKPPTPLDSIGHAKKNEEVK